METLERVEQNRIKNQIQHFISIGRYKKIKSLAADLISEYPEYGYGYYAMSYYEYHQRRIENAIELCIRAREYGMNHLATGLLLMICYDEIDDYPNADAEYHALMQDYPFCYDAMALHGHFLFLRGHRDEGMALLQKAFAENPNDPMVIKFLLTAVKDGEADDRLLKLYLDSSASDQQKLLMAGQYEIYRKNWGEAKKCFEKALGMDPTSREAMYFLSIIKLKNMIPLSFLFTIVVFVLFYFILGIQDDYSDRVFFVLPIIVALMGGYSWLKVRSISGNRSSMEGALLGFLDGTERSLSNAVNKWYTTTDLGAKVLAYLKRSKKRQEKFYRNPGTKWILSISISLIIVGSTLIVAQIQFEEHSVTTMAQVSGFSEEGYPIISYVAAGKEYKKVASEISDAAIGSMIEVKYHREYPKNVRYNENATLKWLVPVTVLISLVALGYELHRYFKR